MTKAWQAIQSIAWPVIGTAAILLTVLGFPLAILVAVLLPRRYFRSPRPGVLGLEDVFNGLVRLSWKCGLVVAMLAVLALFLESRH
jgi:hypothetical protein